MKTEQNRRRFLKEKNFLIYIFKYNKMFVFDVILSPPQNLENVIDQNSSFTFSGRENKKGRNKSTKWQND